MSCTWETKAGITTRTIKLFAERAFASGDRTKVKRNPVSHLQEFITVVDLGKYNSGAEYPWVNINLKALSSIKVSGNLYNFKK